MRPYRSAQSLLAGASKATRTTSAHCCRREISILSNPLPSIQSSNPHNNQINAHPTYLPNCVTRGANPLSSATQRRHASSSTPSSELSKTPLNDLHVSLNAKLVPFAGFAMPLDYPDLSHRESHLWTRAHASLFDVSHMVQHKMSGELAEEFLATITPTAINEIEKYHSSLSTLLNEQGGIVDDTVITRIGKDSFYFVTNAGCRETDLPFIEAQRQAFLKSKSASEDKIAWHVLDNHALLAFQGPEAASILQALVFNDTEDDTLDTNLDTLYFGTCRWLQLTLPETATNTPSLLISRTGYTGEDGFEISIPPENGNAAELAISIAKALTADSSKVRWAGLGARDSLRLEAGMCLYGHDINDTITPPEAALGWIVGKSRRGDNPKPPYNGHEKINKQLASPKTMGERRVGFLVEKGPAAREGAEIVDIENNNEVIGHITSGSPSPSMDGQNIAMGYIKNGYHKRGTKVGLKVRKNIRKAEVAKMPFVENKFYRPAA
ncbi:glycine cleavage system T protein [Exophiala mesophila]|uniref:Aminomethyltransferase n=1 Tax=Exophiala mesophila TaxID=212818 RepID=A0A0D1WKZ0_EXOME|nr:glycine cleavage system T protein [Exophiala mesophila]KIV89655.1 glycine cleavage system T protein [Exophiala mesophila]